MVYTNLLCQKKDINFLHQKKDRGHHITQPKQAALLFSVNPLKEKCYKFAALLDSPPKMGISCEDPWKISPSFFGALEKYLPMARSPGLNNAVET